MLKRYMLNILISLDQFLNTLLGGDPDQTISSRCGKIVREGDTCKICTFLCYFLDKIDRNHCKTSIEEDEGKNSLFR